MSDEVEQYILAQGDTAGPEMLAALQRALGKYNGVGYRMGRPTAPEDAYRRAVACWLAEDDALHVLRELRDWCDEEIKEIVNPSEQQDERVGYRSHWRGADDVIIALNRLARARNDARPAR